VGEPRRFDGAKDTSPGAVEGAASPGETAGEAALRIAAGAAARIAAAVAGIARHWDLGGRPGVGRSCRATGGIAAWGLRI